MYVYLICIPYRIKYKHTYLYTLYNKYIPVCIPYTIKYKHTYLYVCIPYTIKYNTYISLCMYTLYN